MLENPKSFHYYQGDNMKDNTMGNQQASATEAELGWLAGIIDGEGYIGLQIEWKTKRNQDRIAPQIHISNCDEVIILRARDILRKIGINPYIRATKANSVIKRDQYRLQMKRYSVILKLLNIITPYLTGEKKERAELVREFCEVRLATPREGILKPHTARELEIYDICKPKQKRGASETERQARRNTSVIWSVMRTRQLEAAKIQSDLA